MSQTCRICLSPYYDEIINLWNQKTPHVQIYHKYAPKLNYQESAHAFEALVWRCIRNEHKQKGIIISTTNAPDTAVKPSAVSISNFAKRYLELGMEKLSTMSSSEIKMQDVINAQRLALEEKKVKISEDVMMIQMGKMFGTPGEIIDATIEEEKEKK